MSKQNSFGFDVPIQVHADDPPWMPKYQKGQGRNEAIGDMVNFVQGYKETSREAYQALIENGGLGKQEKRICKALSEGVAMTLKELSKETGIEINAVSGRVNGLKKKKVLVETEKRACRVTGKTVTPVRVRG